MWRASSARHPPSPRRSRPCDELRANARGYDLSVRWLIAALCFGAYAAIPSPAATQARAVLVVTPMAALTDAPVDIRATGLRAHEAITLQATTRDMSGKAWRSNVAYEADRRGVVDTHSGMRLFWSMALVGARPGSTQTLVLPNPSSVELTVTRGHQRVAAKTLTRRTSARDVRVTQLSFAQDGLVGTYSSQPARSPRPAVLALGGSGGGHGRQPSLLASHGIPTLALGYFGEPGLPAQLKDIPLEYFQKALRWLSTQPGVDPQRIAVVGISRGAELALLLAADFPDLVHGAVACTTASHVLGAYPPPASGPAWTLGGKPIPFGLLPVDKITVPTLITGGGEDQIIDSGPATKELLDVARAHGRTNVTGRIYPEAGHGVGCRQPNLPVPSELEISPRTFLSLGGTPTANARAAASTWPALLRFLNSL
jgi:dienelactone hydrolase